MKKPVHKLIMRNSLGVYHIKNTIYLVVCRKRLPYVVDPDPKHSAGYRSILFLKEIDFDPTHYCRLFGIILEIL
jgi:hypothetical protein